MCLHFCFDVVNIEKSLYFSVYIKNIDDKDWVSLLLLCVVCHLTLP